MACLCSGAGDIWQRCGDRGRDQRRWAGCVKLSTICMLSHAFAWCVFHRSCVSRSTTALSIACAFDWCCQWSIPITFHLCSLCVFAHTLLSALRIRSHGPSAAETILELMVSFWLATGALAVNQKSAHINAFIVHLRWLMVACTCWYQVDGRIVWFWCVTDIHRVHSMQFTVRAVDCWCVNVEMGGVMFAGFICWLLTCLTSHASYPSDNVCVCPWASDCRLLLCHAADHA